MRHICLFPYMFVYYLHRHQADILHGKGQTRYHHRLKSDYTVYIALALAPGINRLTLIREGLLLL